MNHQINGFKNTGKKAVPKIGTAFFILLFGEFPGRGVIQGKT
jgi:hypothetical protein